MLPMLLMSDDSSKKSSSSDSLMMMLMMQSMGDSPVGINNILPFLMMGDKSDDDSMLLKRVENYTINFLIFESKLVFVRNLFRVKKSDLLLIIHFSSRKERFRVENNFSSRNQLMSRKLFSSGNYFFESKFSTLHFDGHDELDDRWVKQPVRIR